MSYADAGFNEFLDRSVGATADAQNLSSLPSVGLRDLNLDQMQVSGSLANTFQLGGTMAGGKLSGGEVDDATLRNLKLIGRLVVGNNAFTIDGSTIQLVIKDDQGVDRIVLGKLVGGF